jgi:uncharacterized protein (TIGR02246 family)
MRRVTVFLGEDGEATGATNCRIALAHRGTIRIVVTIPECYSWGMTCLSRSLALSLIVSSILAVGACAPEPPPPPAPAEPVADAPADIAAINAARAAFMAAYEKGDAEAIGELYAPEAISEPNGQPTLSGRDAIVTSLTRMFEQVSVKPVLTPAETRTLGSVGLDRGTYTVTVTPKAGAPPSSSQGRYMVVFVKLADGSWKVSRDMDNALGLPPPTTPSPATNE